MAENKSDTPKRKHLVWLDGNEIKILDFGYDWHTNIKTQAFLKAERKEAKGS